MKTYRVKRLETFEVEHEVQAEKPQEALEATWETEVPNSWVVSRKLKKNFASGVVREVTDSGLRECEANEFC